MSISDTTPPEVSITELYITHIDGKGYIQVSGSYEDASELHSLSMSYNMKDEQGNGLPGSSGISISELNGDGTFSVLHEISDNIPNGELNINQLLATDINGNRLVFSGDDLQAVNDLIPDPTYVRNPDSSDTTPPEVSITELYITHIDGKGYIQVSGSYEDASELHSLSMSYNMKDEQGNGLPGSSGISISELNGDGTFSVLHEISDNIPNGELNINQLLATDINGNRLQFSADDLQAVNDLIPDPTYVKNPGSADDDDPLDQADPVEPESLDLTLNGGFVAPTDGSLGYIITLSTSFSGYNPVAGDRLLATVSTSPWPVTDSLSNQQLVEFSYDAETGQFVSQFVDLSDYGPNQYDVRLVGDVSYKAASGNSFDVNVLTHLESFLSSFVLVIGTEGSDYLTEVSGDWTKELIILGGGGNDRIIGGDSNDTIYGGYGSDLLNGWTGDDTYIIHFYDGDSEHPIEGGIDVIEDGSGSNTILLDGSVLSDPFGPVEYSLSSGALEITTDPASDPNGEGQGVVVNDVSDIEYLTYGGSFY